MAVNKSKADLLSQAATTLADNTTQAISPQDVREMAENLAESNFNKITDNALVGLKAYDSGVIYKVSQGVNYNGVLYFANKDTTPGPFNSADWDQFAEQSNVVISGKKASAGTIAKGKPVYLVGFDNDLHTVEEANASAAGTTPVIGFTAEPFNTTDGKNIITFGKLDGIDTSAFSVGDDLYLATSAGGLTATRPTGGGSIVQRIAKVLKSSATGGQILIYNTARAAGLPNLTTNKIWYGNTNGQPEELGIGTGLTVTGGNLTAAGGGSIYSQDGTVSGDRVVNLNSNDLDFKDGDLSATLTSFVGASNPQGKFFSIPSNRAGYFDGSLWFRNLNNATGATTAHHRFYSGGLPSYVGAGTATADKFSFGKTNNNSGAKFEMLAQYSGMFIHNNAPVTKSFLGLLHLYPDTGAGTVALNVENPVGTIMMARGNANREVIIRGANVIGTEKISLQGHTVIQGEGTSTGTTLALYDNDTTPNKIFEILDNGSFTLGRGATTANESCVAIGKNAEATNTNNTIAIGNGSDAKGNYDIAIGNNSSAETNNGIAIGSGAKILAGTYGIAIGDNAESTAGGGISLGVNTKSNTYSVALGHAAQNSTPYAIALGYLSNVSGINSIAIGGRGNTVSGARSILLSTNNLAQTNSVDQTFVVNLNDTTNALYIGQSADSYFGGSGNFGFGTTTPSAKLHVEGTSKLNGTLDMDNNRITNAVINPSVQEAASSATFTINADEQSDGVLTAMAAATTIAAPTGTPVQSQSLVFRFKDDGTARAITWNAIFRAIGVTLPTTTTANKLLYVGCKYNSTDTKWDVVSVQEEA